jgi:hypothetical protein
VRVVQRVLTVAVPATALLAVAWWSGGYFPRSWGALLLAAAIGLAAVAITAERVELGRRAALLVGALVALAVWQVVTTAWAVAPDAPVLEAERTLVYVSALALAFLAVWARRAADLVLGVLVGVGAVTVSGLVVHALGSGTADDRLELPVGYPNAAGIVAATTLVLGLGLAGDASSHRRAVAAGLAVPAAVALALSLSRGSILATVLGVLVLCLATTSARELATVAIVAIPPGLAVLVVALAGRLQDDATAPREALALLAVATLALVCAGVAVVRGPTSGGPEPATGSRRARAILVGACVLAAIGLVAVAAHEVRQSRSTPTTLEGAPDRLLSTSTSSRGDYWDVAAGMVEDHPLGGAGAGGFTRVWLRERPALLFVRDAHNLYLETLAELGPLGLMLLLAALATPLLGMRGAASSATGRAALAAYLALLAHAALDWDWELPAVTLCTLFLAVALVRLGAAEPGRRLSAPGRAALLSGAAMLGAASVVVYAGNGATADANDLLDRGDAAAARSAAERAQRFRPWAAEPWELIGEAELALGHAGDARTHLRRALREDPRSWSAWLSLGVASTGRERTVAIGRARSLNPLAPEVEALSGAENP